MKTKMAKREDHSKANFGGPHIGDTVFELSHAVSMHEQQDAR